MSEDGEDAPDVEFTEDQLDHLASVLMNQGVSTGAVERVVADLTGEDPPSGSEYIRPSAGGDGPDVPLELMNLARHLHDKSTERRKGARTAASEESAILSDQLADAYADAADDVRELSRWLDGDREDPPAFLPHGMELARGGGVPWRDSGEDSEPRTDGGQVDIGEVHAASVLDADGTAILAIKGTDGAARVTVPEHMVDPLRHTVSELGYVYGEDVETGDGDVLVGDGGIPEDVPPWEQKAHKNVQKWGLQPVDALLLAMGEEMGELAGEVHGMADYPGADGEDARMAEQGRDLIRRMDQLGRDIRDYLETVSEDADGNPIPEDERPNYLDPFPEDLKPSRRARLIRSELDDLMALGYQFLWALETDAGGTGGDA